MSAKPLQPFQPVTAKGDRPSLDLVEVIQRLVDEVDRLKARVEQLENP